MDPNKQMQQQQLAITILKMKRERKKNREGEREKRTKKKVNKQQETEQMIDLLANASDSSIVQPLFINLSQENFFISEQTHLSKSLCILLSIRKIKHKTPKIYIYRIHVNSEKN